MPATGRNGRLVANRLQRPPAENANDVIWVLNLTKRRFTYISPAIYRLRGYTVEEAMAESLENAKRTNQNEMAKYATLVRAAAGNAHRLLENLLEWARSQMGNLLFAPQHLSIADAIAETIHRRRSPGIGY